MGTLIGDLSKLQLRRLAPIAVVRGGVTASNLAVFAVLGRAYGVDIVGQFASYLAVVILIGSLVAAGLPEMLMRRVSAAGLISRRSLQTLRTPYWAMALMLAIASVAPSYFVIEAIERALSTNLPAVGALGPGAYVFGLLVSEECRGRGRAEASLVAVNFGTILAPMAGVLVAFVLGVPETSIIATLVWVQVSASILMGVGFAVTAGIRKTRWASCVRVWRTLPWLDLVSMAAMRLLSAGAAHITVLIVGAFGTPSLAGFVAVSTRLAGLAATYTGIVNAAFARRIGAAFKDRAESGRLFLQTSALSTLGVAALMVPIIFMPKVFLGLFGVDGALAGAEIGLQILATSRILRALAGVSDLFLLVRGRAYLELVATIVGFASLLSSLVLLPASPVGVSSALAISALVHGAMSAGLAVSLTCRPPLSRSL